MKYKLNLTCINSLGIVNKVLPVNNLDITIWRFAKP